MKTLANRIGRLESGSSGPFRRAAEMSDDQLNHYLWEYILPLCPKYGISDAPKHFPGTAEADLILGDHFNAMLQELAQ